MKKLVVLALVAAMCFATQAAFVDWEFGAADEDVGNTVYVMWGNAVDSFASISAITDAALDFGEIEAGKRSNSATGAAETGIAKADIGDTESLYFVVVNADSSGYYISPTQTAEKGYFYEGVETPVGSVVFDASDAGLSYTKFGGNGGGTTDVPEPTSGLLLVVGGALLALRRKQK